MADPRKSLIAQYARDVKRALARARRVLREKGPTQVQFWLIALAVGIAAGFAALAFRNGIEWLQKLLYGTDDPRHIHSFAESLPWFWILAIPTIGGLVVGVILNRFTSDGRVHTVADVIEGAALRKGRVDERAGLASAAASLITLSSGGSSGREGPVVHLAGVIASWVNNRIHADGVTGRDLLGCAVAAGVSASFNAPIAGALFALEVVLRHFAVHAFAPIVIASAAGTVISRLQFGDVTEFVLPQEGILAFYVELPAFVLLGLVSGIVAVLLMRAVFVADDVGNWAHHNLRLPRILRPALAGLVLGAVAIAFPHIIGVGYETTSAALTGNLLLWEAVVFTVVKIFAVAVTLGGRMGGGIFSPALMVGAMTGLAFGLIATGIFPDVSGSETLYALAGMGAVAAAVLGAPISTTLIVFELTGDWQTGLAVMVAVSISTAIASRLVHRSFFLTHLERGGIHVAAGPQAYLLSVLRVHQCMRGLDDERAASREACEEMMAQGVTVAPEASLEKVMPVFERDGWSFIPVVRRGEGGEELLGALFQVDALKVYNTALAAAAAEEHG